jgi:hypothetical protein
MGKYIRFSFLFSVLIWFSGCQTVPEYPVVPSISFNSVYFKELPGSDIIYLTINYKDGDGDLGLSNDDLNTPPFFGDSITVNGKKIRNANRFNIFPVFYRKNGNKYDSVLANDFDSNKKVISLGVGKNIDLELYFAKLGLVVFLCDGTISRLPVQHKNFYFINKNVYGEQTDGGGVNSLESNPHTISINELFSEIKEKYIHSNEHILLIDIEGSEYDVLEKIKLEYLLSCRQITIEFHGVFEKLKSSNSKLFEIVENLGKYFELVSVHGNNFGASLSEDNQDYADVIETTWLRKDIDVFKKGINKFNTELCNPNNPKDKDLNLNW